jgi:hypothetical protein
MRRWLWHAHTHQLYLTWWCTQDPVAIFWYDPSSKTEELVQVCRAREWLHNRHAIALSMIRALSQYDPADLDTPVPLSSAAKKRVPAAFQDYYASS